MFRFQVFRRHRPWLLAPAVVAVAALLGGCAGTSQPVSGSEGASGSSASTDDAAAGTASYPRTVTLVTHDSFAVDDDVLAAFEEKSGIDLKILAQGDAGAMLSTVTLTKDNPLGDAVFGIDNTFAGKALDAGILAPYTSSRADDGASDFALGDGHLLTAIDYGDVCVNVDHEYFADHNLTEPQTFEDLAKPQYENMLVTEDAATSSPGLAFLLATIGHFGDRWQQYWTALKGNGLKVESGWTAAYTVDFSGSSGNGDRPLVVSYASSPPDEVQPGDTTAPTGALLDTCFRQVEYAGVLAGAEHPDAAGKVIDFLLSPEFQQQIPGQMYMYPVDSSVELPGAWATYAPLSDNPETVPAADIEAHRKDWIEQWSDLMHG